MPPRQVLSRGRRQCLQPWSCFCGKPARLKGCITARACDVAHLQVCQKHPAKASTGARCSALWLDEGISDSLAMECSCCCNCCRLHKMPQDTGKIPQSSSMNLTTVGPNIPKTLRFLCVIGRYLTGILRLQEKQNTSFVLRSSQDDRLHRGVRPDRRYLTGIFPVSWGILCKLGLLFLCWLLRGSGDIHVSVRHKNSVRGPSIEFAREEQERGSHTAGYSFREVQRVLAALP